ncbi:cell division protein ZapA [Parashewanella curva]|uniref:Cell division protein ZapA n=1 Tax=Parashewanella curva TaxID=2338552 RepID=A0A3L8PWP5_9GAMM|nr:cell division protein ZapA [Parashewanella curva]RLV58868.1 cell division protein ZapA [Parashewanella curva]
MSNKAVNIMLLGRTYSISCPAQQEVILVDIAARLEKQLEKLNDKSPNFSREEIVIMAALNLGHELYTEQQKNKEYQLEMSKRISLLQNTLEKALLEKAKVEK